ncbi:MAG: nucleotidyltransferase domain-containing protein [Nanoarchaeota archaeon]|nr:nucleotidyltransferase domain-containing protein [Nanoarchaeota archaeon]
MILDDMRIDVIEEFLSDFSSKITGSSIAKKKKLNQKSVSNILNELEKESILKSEIQGRNKLYSLNMDNKDSVKKFLASVENLREIRFYKKYPLIKEISSKIAGHIKGSAAIFGSYAKNLAKKGSDLDILVVGKADEREIDKISEVYRIDINIKVYKPLLRIDALIKEVMGSHIAIKGAEDFLSQLMEIKHGKD